MNIPYRGQAPFRRSLSFPESTRQAPWTAPHSSANSSSPVGSTSGRFLLPASLPERADAMLSKSLLEQCRLDSSSRETSPRSSLTNYQHCGSWKSRGGMQKPVKPSVAPLSCSTQSPKEGRPRGRFIKQEGTPIRSPHTHVSALSAALGASGSPEQVNLAHIVDLAERRRLANRSAQRSYRMLHPFSLCILTRQGWFPAEFGG